MVIMEEKLHLRTIKLAIVAAGSSGFWWTSPIKLWANRTKPMLPASLLNSRYVTRAEVVVIEI